MAARGSGSSETAGSSGADTGPARSRPDDASARIDGATWRIAGVIVFGAFASGLDASLVNVGLDTIGRELQSGLGQVQWVSTGYLLALAMSLPLSGWLGRRWGAGRLWLGALAAFTLASALCALAPSVESLVALRVVQGLAGGLLIPSGQTVLGQAVGPQRLGRVMASLGVVVTVGPALGPIVGGLLLSSWSWRWLFAINLPIGALGLALGWALIPRGGSGTTGGLDWRGLAYVSLGVPALVYALTNWSSGGSPSPALLWLTLGVLLIACFIVRSLRQEHPLMNLHLYRNPSFSAANAASFFSGALLFGTGLLFPLYFQILRQDTVLETGLRLLSLSGGTAITLPMVGRLIDRHGGGIVALGGSVAAVAASAPFLVLPSSANAVLLQALLVVLGMAISLAAVPPGIAAYKTVAVADLPDATAQVNIVQRVGGALGGAIFAVVISRGLAGGAEAAFHAATMSLVGISLASLGAATWLWRALRSARDAEPGRNHSVDNARPAHLKQPWRDTHR